MPHMLNNIRHGLKIARPGVVQAVWQAGIGRQLTHTITSRAVCTGTANIDTVLVGVLVCFQDVDGEIGDEEGFLYVCSWLWKAHQPLTRDPLPLNCAMSFFGTIMFSFPVDSLSISQFPRTPCSKGKFETRISLSANVPEGGSQWSQSCLHKHCCSVVKYSVRYSFYMFAQGR